MKILSLSYLLSLSRSSLSNLSLGSLEPRKSLSPSLLLRKSLSITLSPSRWFRKSRSKPRSLSRLLRKSLSGLLRKSLSRSVCIRPLPILLGSLLSDLKLQNSNWCLFLFQTRLTFGMAIWTVSHKAANQNVICSALEYFTSTKFGHCHTALAYLSESL